MAKKKEKLLSVSESAEILGVVRQRVLQLIYQDRLDAEKVGRQYVIRESSLKDVANRKNGRPKKKTKK